MYSSMVSVFDFIKNNFLHSSIIYLYLTVFFQIFLPFFNMNISISSGNYFSLSHKLGI